MNVQDQREEFVDRLLQSARGTFDIFTIYIGHRLGLYTALASGGALTPTEVASRTGTQERYVREWLEQQTVGGILEVEDETAPAADRRFHLPSGRAEVLIESESLDYLAPLVQLLVGAARPVPSVLDAFRTGGGVPYRDYGSDLIDGQAAINRTSFLQLIGSEWIPAMEDVHERLLSKPPARVADVGCGAGWSSIGIARSYPNIHVDGFDLDEPSIELARANVEDAGLSDRVQLHVRDAGDPQLQHRYDLVTAFECIHDLSRPVDALRAMRKLMAEGGAALVVDERVGDSFTAGGNDVEWMMYGWSVLHCLPVGMADQPSAATGTVMRTDTFTRYAKEAGFRDVEVLPIENFFFRFYRLRP
jgi:SAM-dependent methyltransferase